MVKLTFSLDEETVRLFRAVGDRRRKAQSMVVREATAEYAAREDADRARRLQVLEKLAASPPTR